MALVLVTTPGAANANAYATVADATAVAVALWPETTWQETAQDTQHRALVTAARILDTLPWTGSRATDTQALAWPRFGAVDHRGLAVESTVVPPAVRDANGRLAIWIATQTEDPEAPSDLLAISSMSLGSGISFDFTGTGTGDALDVFLRTVIRPLLFPLVQSPQLRVVRA